jgi:hypothetical protein
MENTSYIPQPPRAPVRDSREDSHHHHARHTSRSGERRGFTDEREERPYSRGDYFEDAPDPQGVWWQRERAALSHTWSPDHRGEPQRRWTSADYEDADYHRCAPEHREVRRRTPERVSHRSRSREDPRKSIKEGYHIPKLASAIVKLRKSRSPSIHQFESDVEEGAPVIEDYDEEGCLILNDLANKKAEVLKNRPRFSSSSSEDEYPPRGRSPKRRRTQALVTETSIDRCDSEAEFGCKPGCEKCQDYFLCDTCKGDYTTCSCYLQDTPTGTSDVTTATESKSGVTFAADPMEQRMIDMESRFAAMERDLVAEKQKNLLLEQKLQGDRSTSPDSKGSRRRQIGRAHV